MSETEAIEKRKFGRIPVDTKNTLHYEANKQAGGIKEFIKFLSHSTSDVRAGLFVKKWKSRWGKNPASTLDELCERMDLDPVDVFSWACEGAREYLRKITDFKNAYEGVNVVQANIDIAKTPSGFKDRQLFYVSTGLKPTVQGARIQVNQSNVNTANAASKSETSLPNFDALRRDIAEAARADE